MHRHALLLLLSDVRAIVRHCCIQVITGDVREDILLNLLAQPQFENVRFIRVEGPWDTNTPGHPNYRKRAGSAI